jgi:hypothetical protein
MARLVGWALAGLLVSTGAAWAQNIDVQGRLEPGDETLPERQYYDAYQVQVSAGRPVHIEISGMEMMPVLMIYNSASELIEHTSGSYTSEGYGLGTDWQPAASGMHWIVVTQSWRDETDYRLQVTFAN